MRKVDLPEGSPRGGILTQATFHLVTSNPTRTSPVKRGLFVLENFLATPPPPAVPDVPPLEDSAKGKNKNLTLREILAIHAEQKVCASCHVRMDPIGLALENYSAIGVWRDTEKGRPIDASGELMTGEKFTNARELSTILATVRKEDFHRARRNTRSLAPPRRSSASRRRPGESPPCALSQGWCSTRGHW